MTIQVKDANGATQTVKTIDDLADDGGQATLGAKTDAKSTATDSTSVSGISIWKQISASVQSLVSNATSLGQAAASASLPVVPASNWVYNAGYYVTVAASQTDQVIQSSSGAAGDYLDRVIIFPGTTAAGAVTIKDNATTVGTWAGGGSTALLTLTPFVIPIGAVSRSGAWKITTLGNVTVLAIGRFS